MPCIAIEHSCGPRLNNLEIRVAGSGKNVEYYKVKSYLGHIKNLILCDVNSFRREGKKVGRMYIF